MVVKFHILTLDIYVIYFYSVSIQWRLVCYFLLFWFFKAFMDLFSRNSSAAGLRSGEQIHNNAIIL